MYPLFFTGFCKAWWRVEVLIKRGYIRRRSQKKIPVLELLPIGKVVAVRLRGIYTQHFQVGFSSQLCQTNFL